MLGPRYCRLLQSAGATEDLFVTRGLHKDYCNVGFYNEKIATSLGKSHAQVIKYSALGTNCKLVIIRHRLALVFSLFPHVAPQPAELRPLHFGEWTHVPTPSDLEGDNTITHRVVEALQAVATPFTANPGKHAIFPHDTVTRGLKKQKCNRGELTLPEYLRGIIQLIKANDPADEDVFYMNLHLERWQKTPRPMTGNV